MCAQLNTHTQICILTIHAHTKFANVALLEVVHGHISRMVDMRYLSPHLTTR